MNLAQRAAATRSTWESFRGVPLRWNGATCAHVLHDHLINAGHTPPAVPTFRTKKGAREALAAMGVANLVDVPRMLGLEEITPASMVVGDIGLLPGDGNRTDGIRAAIAICAGNGKFMGWHGAAEGFRIIGNILPHVKAAFRI